MYLRNFFIQGIIKLVSGAMLLPSLTLAAPAPIGAPWTPKAVARLSTVDWEGYSHRDTDGQGTYAFGYDVEDPETDNVQYRAEERHSNGTVTGRYGYLQPDGNLHLVEYVADYRGYRAHVRIESRGHLKPVPVNDQTVHQDIQSDVASLSNPWRRQNQDNFKIGALDDIPLLPPAPAMHNLAFDINGTPYHHDVGNQQHTNVPGPTLYQQLPADFVTVNQDTAYIQPDLVYLHA